MEADIRAYFIKAKNKAKELKLPLKGQSIPEIFTKTKCMEKASILLMENTYTGDFSNDDIEGQGICKWVNGKKYEGQWSANKMHG